MGVDPSTMVALIDELEAAGLAKRRPHPKDRRAREVVITSKGRRLLERGRQMASQVEDEVLGGLSAGERRELLRLLRRALDSAPAQPLWSALRKATKREDARGCSFVGDAKIPHRGTGIQVAVGDRVGSGAREALWLLPPRGS